MLDQQMYTLEQIEVVKFHSSDVSEKRIYDHFSILITIGGKGEFRIEDKRYGLNQTGQVFFGNPGTELYYTIHSKYRCSFRRFSICCGKDMRSPS